MDVRTRAAFVLLIALSCVNEVLGQAAPWLVDQPVIVGDFFGFGPSRVTLTDTASFSFDTSGFLVSGAPGDASSVLVFEANGGTADDFFTTGIGTDTSGDGLPDRFQIVEPLPPNEVPTSPGTDYQYDGGSVVYTRTAGPTQAVNGTFNDGENWLASYSFSRPLTVEIGAGAAGGVASRRIKVSENNSAVPRDRVMFDYRFFNNAISGLGDVNRYVFGFEKASQAGYGSIDVRVPFASTLDSVRTLGGVAGRDIELGNLMITWKQVLYFGGNSLFSGGVGLGLPTADDTVVRLRHGPKVLEIENDALHFMPFLSYITSNSRETFQAFLQLDIDSNGNPVNGDLSATRLRRLGTLDDATWLFFDIAYSNWTMQCDDPCARGLTGVAPFIELHYSTTLNEVDRVVGNGLDVGNDGDEFDIFNITTGLHLRYASGTFVTPAVAFPIQSDGDNAFDFEFALLVNKYF